MSKATNWKEIVVNTLYLRDNGLCPLCMRTIADRDLFETDHIVEKAKGGQDEINNLRLVHIACHKQRHASERLSIPIDIIKRAYKERVLIPPITSKVASDTKGNIEDRHRQEIVALLKNTFAKTQNITRAAEEMGISRFQFSRLAKKYDIIFQHR